jgi:replicative DNA helicase
MNFQENIHYSRNFEYAVLGACLIEKNAFGRTFGIIDVKCFYTEGSQIVYSSLMEMYHQNIPVDIFTVTDFVINRLGKNEIMGFETTYFICQLTNAVVSSAHIEYHCYVLKRMWMERELINLTHGGLKLQGEVKAQIIQLTEAIQKINQGEYTKEWEDMSDLVYKLMIHQDEISRTGGKGIITGIPYLDRENGGFFPGQMIVIGARPSVGKSAFMGQLAINMAQQGKKVGIISLEMSNNEIAARLSSLETDADFKTIFRNLYADENSKLRWYEQMKNVVDLPIFVSDNTKVTHVDIRAKATKLMHKEGLDCLMIDYLQLISSDEAKNKTRENEVSQISRMCKLMAKDLGIPVIVLCQLNRAVTQRSGPNRYPHLSDLRESGSIEQDADIVMFLHRDWLLGDDYKEDENGESTENKADLVIRKWRNGMANLQIPLTFDAPRMKFNFGGQQQQFRPIKPESVDYQGDNPF